MPIHLAPLAALFLASCQTEAEPVPAADWPYVEGAVTVDGVRTPYLLLPPAEVEPDRRYPLVLFLHGSGEQGDDNRAQVRHFPERMAAEYRERFPCYVLAPQAPADTAWTEVGEGFVPAEPGPDLSPPLAGAAAALLEVARNHPVDLDRIHLTGLSRGGFGAFALAARYPGWFASVAPVCGGGHADGAAALAGVPLSVWHGDADEIVPVERSREMVAALEAVGAAADYREVEGAKHDVWNVAYGAEGLLDWMFAQRRAPDAELAATARLLAEAVRPDEVVAFLGDSITEAGAAPGGYVHRLSEVLEELRPGARVVPAGISGHKVPDLLARYEADVVAEGATLVFVYIGINDVWHHDSGRGTPADEYEAGLHTLIRGLRASGAEVVLATPTVIGERPFGTNRLDGMLADFADRSRRVAREEGVVLCDLARAFADDLALRNPAGAPMGALTWDEVHLNGEGNRLVAVNAARALRRAALGRD